MSSFHTVAQGEHLSGIAKAFGFASLTTIWNHPQNAELRGQRDNPGVLLPGDRVFIPDKAEKRIPVATDRAHRFVVQAEPLQLRLVLRNVYAAPIANAPCELSIDDVASFTATDGTGTIERNLSRTARSAALTVHDPKTSLADTPIPIRIGHLDPVEVPSGQSARLNNLAYFAGPVDGQSDEENDAMFLSAVEEFQCDQGLKIDGRCGAASQARLLEVHGC